jgi:hypothetical protein
MGSGSGMRTGARATTENYHSLDVRRLAREGILEPGYAGGWNWLRRGEVVASIGMCVEENCVLLTYRHCTRGNERISKNYLVYIAWTRCHFGGRRPWWLCPNSGCGRRVAVLYSSEMFLCRHCLDLAYPSQRKSTGDRALRRAGRIRERLGWIPGIINPKGFKPKGMHWRTFDRLNATHDSFANVSLVALAQWLKTLE